MDCRNNGSDGRGSNVMIIVLVTVTVNENFEFLLSQFFVLLLVNKNNTRMHGHFLTMFCMKICTIRNDVPWRRGVAVECRTRDQEVAGLSFGWALRHKNSGQVSHTYVPLSPSSITWYWPKGGDACRLGR